MAVTSEYTTHCRVVIFLRPKWKGDFLLTIYTDRKRGIFYPYTSTIESHRSGSGSTRV